MSEYDDLIGYQKQAADKSSGGDYGDLIDYANTKAPEAQPGLSGQPMGPIGRGISTAIKTALPVDAIQEMAGQAMHKKPFDPMAMAGSVAQLGLASAPMLAGPLGAGAKAAMMGGGAAGLTAGALESADVKNPIARAGLPFLAGLAAGHYANPQTALKAVPKGDEANAVARFAQRIGVPVEEASRQKGILGFGGRAPYPQDTASTWERALNALGQRVGSTKGPALETSATTRQILQKMQGVNSGLEAPGVLNFGGAPIPALSNNPGALGLIGNRLGDALEAIRANKVPPAQAMEGLNNALEGLKKTVSESGNFGENMAGQAANAGTTGWQEALNNLAKNPEALAEHNLANKDFRKGLALKGMVDKAVSTKAGAEAGFNPRAFGFDAATAGIKKGSTDLSALSPEEMQGLRQLVEGNPGIIRKGVNAITNIQKDLGREPLHFHPSTRFYEQMPVSPLNPLSSNAGPAAGAAYRSATYDPTQDEQTQKAVSFARRLSQVGK